MFKCNPLFLLDFYKATHAEQYPKNLTKLVSYFTPRTSRLIPYCSTVCLFGLQYFIKRYLIESFEENFFKRNKEEVLKEYQRIMDHTLGKGSYSIEKIAALHDLGYLPLEIRALPEGSFIPMKVPCIEISNTHPDFIWVVNTIETMMSATLWHTMISATVGHKYRKIAEAYYSTTVDNYKDKVKFAMGDFSMRGQESIESATKSSAAFALSFANTATVPAALYLEEYYNCDVEKELVIKGAISTEHSVMCSNYSVDGDEITHIRRLLTEIYPNQSFSMVSDSYDYWNLVTKILPELKEEIMNHNGCLAIRGDSGDPVEILAGRPIYSVPFSMEELQSKINASFRFYDDEDVEKYWHYEDDPIIFCEKDRVFCKYIDYENGIVGEYILTPEDKGTVWCLFEEFGGTTNEKGYKVLNPKIKAIYGDSITFERAKMIYKRLADKGFSAENVSLGVGSYSLQCMKFENKTYPFTRDTFGIAVKSTYAEDSEGNPIFIFKNPKTDTGHFKKSQKGCCKVYWVDWVVDSNKQQIHYVDELTWDQAQEDNLLETVFKDGKMTKEESLAQIRERMVEHL